MVHKVCSVPGCKNNSENNPDLAYHYMPRRDQLRKEWLVSIGSPELFVKPFTTLKGLQVCSKHFTADQYRFPGSKKLNTGAVPNIFEPLTLTLPARLSALLRESIHNAEDTTATAVSLESPMSSRLAGELSIDLPETSSCEVLVELGWDEDSEELSESSDQSSIEHVVPAQTHAQVTDNNIAELGQLLIFKDPNSDNVTYSNTETLINIDKQRGYEEQEEYCSGTTQDLTTEQLSQIIGMVEKVSAHITEVDPNVERSRTIRRTINNAIRCYKQMYEQNKTKKYKHWNKK